MLFSLWFCLFILSGVISPPISSNILDTYWPGEFIFQCPIFLPFHTVHGVLKARILKWFAIPFSSGPCFVRTLHHDPSILGGPTWHGLCFIELDKAVVHVSVWLVFCDCGFHSVCPLMDKDKRIMEAYWWERLIEGETWKVKVKSLSRVGLLATPWTAAYQAPPSMGSQPCLTQWNYEPCHVGSPKMDRSWWRVLTKCGPLEKGMTNHFCIFALRTPWTVWKGKKKHTHHST